MAAQALYRKWRSQTFEDVVGQEHVTLTLRNALRDGRMSHAYLFAGPRGTGKTSTARILAKALNCLADDNSERPCNRCRICTAINEGRQLDLIEIDAASNRGIDEIRDLREKIGFRPNEARYKIYIIDEVHMLTKEAFNALLKTLEEPPPHAVFVLATTEPDRVPETVRSRCQRFDFKRIATAEIVGHLAMVLNREGRRAEEEALVAIARRATGSMRDALSLLDQLLSYDDDLLTLERVQRVLGLIGIQTIGRLVDHIVAADAAAGLSLLNQLVADGVEMGELVDQIVAYLRSLLFLQVTRASEALDLPQEQLRIVEDQAKRLSADALLKMLGEFAATRAALRDQIPGVPQLPLELAFLQSVKAVKGQVPSESGSAPQRPVTGAGQTTSTREGLTETPQRTATPSSAPTVSVPARPAAGADDPELRQAVQAHWDEFLVLAGKRCGMKVQAALRSVKEIDTSNQTIVLQFAHSFSRDLVNQPENRARVEALWDELLRARVQVRCIVAGESSGPAANITNQQISGSREHEDEVFLREARDLGAVVKRLS